MSLAHGIPLEYQHSNTNTQTQVLKFLLELPCDTDFVPEALGMLSRMASTDGDTDDKTPRNLRLVRNSGIPPTMVWQRSWVSSRRIRTTRRFWMLRSNSSVSLRSVRNRFPRSFRCKVDHIMNAFDRHSEEADVSMHENVKSSPARVSLCGLLSRRV